jgi:hypothetical protein
VGGGERGKRKEESGSRRAKEEEDYVERKNRDMIGKLWKAYVRYLSTKKQPRRSGYYATALREQHRLLTSLRMERLDKSTLDSFHLVTQNRADEVVKSKSEGDEHQDPDVKSIERAANESNDEFRSIIRSNGRDPFDSANGSHSKPPLIVALARHIPSEKYFLFAMSPYTVPCKLVRFDRDGVVQNNDDLSEDVPFLWGDVDAAALVAAVEHVERASGSYFSKLTGAADKGDGSGQAVTIQPTSRELAHFLCLVPNFSCV